LDGLLVVVQGLLRNSQLSFHAIALFPGFAVSHDFQAELPYPFFQLRNVLS
jgi:hypothetical protein